jgi:hypothetical protein
MAWTNLVCRARSSLWLVSLERRLVSRLRLALGGPACPDLAVLLIGEVRSLAWPDRSRPFVV